MLIIILIGMMWLYYLLLIHSDHNTNGETNGNSNNTGHATIEELNDVINKIDQYIIDNSNRIDIINQSISNIQSQINQHNIDNNNEIDTINQSISNIQSQLSVQIINSLSELDNITGIKWVYLTPTSGELFQANKLIYVCVTEQFHWFGFQLMLPEPNNNSPGNELLAEIRYVNATSLSWGPWQIIENPIARYYN